jgi:hypothetical protein
LRIICWNSVVTPGLPQIHLPVIGSRTSNFGDTAMKDGNRRSNVERRESEDRRSGKDARPVSDKQTTGERRSSDIRRSPGDRRSGS